MRYRNSVLEDNLTITTADTKTFNLTMKDPISRLSFKFNIANHGTTPVLIAHPARAVTKIEVVDGAHIIQSLSGEQMLAANYYDRRQMPQSYINGVTGTQSYFTCCIDFGRYLWDKELAFDPSLYTNPQIKITYNKALYESSATAMYLTMTADIFDELRPTPVGYLRRYEATTWTPAGTGTETTKVPLDKVLRKMFVTGYCTDNHFRKQVHDFKLSEDGDKKVPFDTNTRSYVADQNGLLPPILEPVLHVGATGTEVIYTMASYEGQFIPIPTAAEDVFLTSYTADVLTVDCATGGGRIEGIARGHVPFHTFEIPFGDQKDIEDWYDVTALGSLELKTVADTAGTSPVGRLILEQLAKF